MTKRAMPGNVLLPAVLAVFLFVLVGDAFALALTIKEAKWESGDKILVVKGIGPARTRVTVKNADDDSIVYGSTRSKRGEGEWKLKKRGLSAPPCSVLAEAGVENNKKTVNGAGSDCVGSVPPIEPPPEDTCDISVAPLTVPFGDVTVGQTGTGSTVVSNNGTATCNVTVVPGGSADFSAVPLSFDVAPDGSQTVSVSYEPGQAGQDTGTLAVNSNDPDTATVNVSLTGNGVAAPVQACNISVTPTALAFGDVNVGQSSELITTVNNTGTADCNVELVQTGSDDFEVALPASFTVAAGGSRNVSVNYAPADAGEDTGNVAVNRNDPDTTTVNVALSGKGVELQACNPADANLSINSTSQNG